MMDAVNIRCATMDDSPILADLSTQLGYPSSPTQTVSRLGLILDSNLHAIRVACLPDGSVVGWVHAFLAFRVESDPFAEIGGLIVAEALRGRGIGRRLLASVEDWVVHSGVTKLRVRSRSNRLDTHIFYEQMGFFQSKQQNVFDKRLKRDT